MDEKKVLPMGADSLYEPDPENGFEAEVRESKRPQLAAEVNNRYQEAKDARDQHERRWIQAYHNYRGIYPKNIKFRQSEQSRVFIKITKTKVVAAYGQLNDVVFGTNSFPIGISETKIPEGIPEIAHVKTEETATGVEQDQAPTESQPKLEDIGYEGDGKVLKPGASLGKSTSLFEEAEESPNVELEYKNTDDPNVPEIFPARDAARAMEKLIHDQIDETNGTTEVRNALFECTLFGTGIVKGPFNYTKQLHQWVKDDDGNRKYEPKPIKVPRSEFVSVWDFFPDPSATTLDECSYIIHRHRYGHKELRALANMPGFDNQALVTALDTGPQYIESTEERELRDEDGSSSLVADKFEVLEYWGVMDAATCKAHGISLPDVPKGDKPDSLIDYQINAWVCNNQILRATVNPFTPARIPYHVFPYERNPYSLFGIGVAENMDDSQQIMNGHARMAIDNMALSGNLLFEIDTNSLESGQDLSIYAGKTFRKDSGDNAQAIRAIKFPNTTNENMLMFDRFRQLADEQTGIPSYSHGQTGVQSTTRTAAGMSMLMGASALNIKTVVKNIDDFLLKPLGKAYFQWNMQFFEGDLSIEGDLEVKAMGTSSLMKKEVRSQRLTTVLQTVANPALAPYVKVHTLLAELAESLDLDPSEFINNPEEALIAAKIYGESNALSAQAQTAAAPNGVPTGPDGLPQGLPREGITGTGNGQIGTGTPPSPDEVPDN